jgi:hypothetical protein
MAIIRKRTAPAARWAGQRAPLMGASDAARVTPVMGPADARGFIPLMGPPDAVTAGQII